MSPRKRTRLPDGIHPDALPQAPGLSLSYDPRGKGRWGIRYYDGGRHREKKIGNGDMPLSEIHARFYEFQMGGQVETLEDLSNELQKTVEFKELAPRTQSDYLDCHNAIMKLKTRTGMAFGKARLAHIKTATIREYRDARAAVSPTRAAHEIRYLKRLFSWGVEMEYVRDNPAKAIRIKGLTKAREHYVEDADYLAMLAVAPLHIALAAHLAYLTGRRRTDILSLTRPQIQPDGIHFIESKTKKATIVAWSDELRATVDLCDRGFFLFPGSPGERYSDRAFSTAWKRAYAKLEKLGYTRFQFKDLRAKHATDLEEAGGDATENLAHGRRGTTTKHYIRKRKVVPLR